MRCFLMKNGHIAAVEFLTAGRDDVLIEQARQHFNRRADECFDDFEVWDGARRVYCFSEDPEEPNPAAS